MAINIFIKVDAVFLCFMTDKLQFKVKKIYYRKSVKIKKNQSFKALFFYLKSATHSQCTEHFMIFLWWHISAISLVR